MNTDTGQIFTPEQIEEFKKNPVEYKFTTKEMREEMLTANQASKLIPMEIPPTETQMKRNPPKVGRNEMCPCGSGLKFKKCCWTGHKT